MNWNISDDELEKIFKQGTEKAQFDYDPDAWSQMELMLNKERKKRRAIAWLKGSFLLAIVATVFIYNYSKNPHSTNQKFVTESSKLENIQAQPTRQNPTTESKESITQSEVESESLLKDPASHPSAKSIIAIGQNPLSNNIDLASNPKNLEKIKPNFSNLTALNTKEVVYKKEGQLIQATMVAEPIKTQEIPSSNNAKNISEIQNNKNQTIEEKDIKKDDVSNTKTIRNEEILSTIESRPTYVQWDNPILKKSLYSIPFLHMSIQRQPRMEIVANKSSGPLMITAGYGIRYTATPATKFGNGDKIYRFGLGYGLSKKISLHINSSYTVDNYTAGYEDYFVYPGYWTRGVKPESTIATCNMLNINLGMNYYLNSIGNSGPYGGLGLSSVYMLKEKYYYKINDPGNDIKRKWYGGGSEDYLSHLDITAGYYLRLLPRLGITINGNYELPIYGIGHGHIRMSGLGLTIGANINIF